MSNVSVDRAKEITDHLKDFGETKTLAKYNITSETLHRYKRKVNYTPERRIPMVLLFDIETTPLQANVWHTGKQRISHESIISDWNIICWSAKWLNKPEVLFDCVTPEEILKRDDKRVTESLWKMFEASDVIIAHNGLNFDIRKSNTRFMLNGLKPPSPYRVIDTLKESRKWLSFSSNRLDYLGKLFTSKGKIHTDYDLWLRCLKGDQEALTYMVNYNKEDVLLLEEVYMELRPWIKSHPNMAVYAECQEESCPTCLSTNLVECGEYTTPAGRYDSLRCKDCGSIMRRRKHIQTKQEKDNLLLPTAR